MDLTALGPVGVLAGAELGAGFIVLLLVHLNPRSPPERVTPVRRAGAMAPVGVIVVAHAVQWAGIAAVAPLPLAPRSAESFVAFGAAWLAGLWAGARLLRRGLMTRCGVDAASARELVIAKLVVHGALWLVACVYARVMM